MRLSSWDYPCRRIGIGAAIIAVALTVAGGSRAWAGILIGVGQDPPPPMGPFAGDDQADDMIMVGSATQPVVIVPVPTGPPWMKEFVLNRDGQGWSTSGPLSMVTVMEYISFAPVSTIPPTEIVDWHEDIDPTVGDGGSFKWAGGIIELGAGGPAIGGTVSADGKSIWFEFPPVPPLTTIKITKQLMWAGSGPITPGPNGTNNYRIKINERPSILPEPTSATLGALALLGVVGGACRRRRRF